MSIPISSQCLSCHLERNLTRARKLGDEATALAFGKELMKLYLSAPEGVSSPWLSPGTAELFRRFYDLGEDPYREEKEQANRFVLARMDQIRAMAEKADDPVFAALQLSVLGNYLDFAALQDKVSFEALEEMLAQALTMALDAQVYQALCDDLAAGNRLLYLTDNAGEIGFDRILAEQLQRKYPHLQITFCVRGGYTLNDATREDAALMALPFPVIDNGNTVSGTELTMLGEEARLALEQADVILAKGMANTETMYGCGYNVYYAFLIKCAKFVQLFGKDMLTPMLVRERR